MSSLPLATNDGQYVPIGSSSDSCPDCASRCTTTLTSPFAHENTGTTVSCDHGRPGAASPSQSSTTLRPPAYTVTAAPSSGNSEKFSANVSATAPYPSSTQPLLMQETIGPARPSE